MALPVYYNADKWIDAHREEFSPPVCTKAMHNDQLKVVYVGGPNQRDDFHIEEGEEFFYMVKGDMVLRVFQNEKFTDIAIKEGEMFLLPARVAHSPQRLSNTIGLLIERERKSAEIDCIRWFVKNSKDVLFESWSHVDNLESAIATVIKQFRSSEQYRTGQPAAGFVSSAPYALNDDQLQMPFSFGQWLQDNQESIANKGYKHVFKTEQTQITVFGQGVCDSFTDLYPLFTWQLKGERQFIVNGKHYDLQKGDTLLIPSDVSFKSSGSKDCLTFVAKMRPKNL